MKGSFIIMVIGILLAFCFSNVYAQDARTFSGQVLDKSKSVPLEYASVAISNKTGYIHNW